MRWLFAKALQCLHVLRWCLLGNRHFSFLFLLFPQNLVILWLPLLPIFWIPVNAFNLFSLNLTSKKKVWQLDVSISVLGVVLVSYILIYLEELERTPWVVYALTPQMAAGGQAATRSPGLHSGVQCGWGWGDTSTVAVLGTGSEVELLETSQDWLVLVQAVSVVGNGLTCCDQHWPGFSVLI